MIQLITRYTPLALALIFAMLTLAQSLTYRTWDAAFAKQTDFQAKLAEADRFNSFPEQLVRRIAVDSVRDPRLVELLKNRGIIVRFSPSESTGGNTPQSSTPPANP